MLKFSVLASHLVELCYSLSYQIGYEATFMGGGQFVEIICSSKWIY